MTTPQMSFDTGRRKPYPDRMRPWAILILALASQVLTLLLAGHAAYLWVQGSQALVAGVALLVVGLRYRRRDPRGSRWPPLLPLAGIALAGGAKDLCVALDAPTPIWLVVLLLGAVASFLWTSWRIWRDESRSPITPNR
ncbi:MAG TPA: hypothetical protein VES67_06460 [Vicinamibacterales bacterium]|nr:hypothetical protein [Vicinamibacterales bacterium]